MIRLSNMKPAYLFFLRLRMNSIAGQVPRPPVINPFGLMASEKDQGSQ